MTLCRTAAHLGYATSAEGGARQPQLRRERCSFYRPVLAGPEATTWWQRRVFLGVRRGLPAVCATDASDCAHLLSHKHEKQRRENDSENKGESKIDDKSKLVRERRISHEPRQFPQKKKSLKSLTSAQDGEQREEEELEEGRGRKELMLLGFALARCRRNAVPRPSCFRSLGVRERENETRRKGADQAPSSCCLPLHRLLGRRVRSTTPPCISPHGPSKVRPSCTTEVPGAPSCSCSCTKSSIIGTHPRIF